MNGITIPELSESHLIWFPVLGYGFLPAHQDSVYTKEYLDNYDKRADTETGKRLNEARHALCARHVTGEALVDVGIGSGAFVDLRNKRRGGSGGPTYGYDVNPWAVAKLIEAGLFRDPYDGSELKNVSLWDTFEHILDPHRLISRVQGHVFVSIPVFTGSEHVLRSKHYKPGEHLWYFTEKGLIRWFQSHAFECVESNRMEEEIGREDIGTYVFKRVA